MVNTLRLSFEWLSPQGLEGYFRDPGFDQNTVRDSENAKYLDGKQDFNATQEVGFAKIWAQDAGFFLP